MQLRLKFKNNLYQYGLGFISIMMMTACSGIGEQAGTTSETENTVSGVVTSSHSGGSLSFTKVKLNSKFDSVVVETIVDDQGLYEVKLEPNSTWFVEYQDDRLVAWVDSLKTGESGEVSVFNIDKASYGWELFGQIDVNILPSGNAHQLIVESTPFNSTIESDGSFSFDRVPLSANLILKWTNESGVNKEAQVENWFSPWIGVQKITHAVFENNILTMDYCTDADTLDLMVSAREQSKGIQGLWNLCHDTLAFPKEAPTENIDSVNQAGNLILSEDGLRVLEIKSMEGTVKVGQFSSPIIRYDVVDVTTWNLFTTTSIAENQHGAVGVYYVPSGSILAKSSSIDSLGKKEWLQEVEVPADSSYRVFIWEKDVLLYNDQGHVELRSLLDLTKIYHEIEVGVMQDLVQISDDLILVLRQGNIVESYELSTGTLLMKKTFPAEPVLYDLGGLY